MDTRHQNHERACSEETGKGARTQYVQCGELFDTRAF